MRLLFKVLLFPLSAVLTLLTCICYFLLGHITWLLNILSSLFFLSSAVMLVMALVDGNDTKITSNIIGIAIAYLLSPYGIPLFAEWIIDKVDQLNDAIKSI